MIPRWPDVALNHNTFLIWESFTKIMNALVLDWCEVGHSDRVSTVKDWTVQEGPNLASGAFTKPAWS